MRGLIFGGIALVLAMVGWVLYLEHLKRTFDESLPKPPPVHTPEATGAGTSPRAAPAEEWEVPTERDMQEAVTDAPMMETPVDGTDATAPAADVAFEAAFGDTSQETETGTLSPELEALFENYYVLTQDIAAVSEVLTPLINEHFSGTQRSDEIYKALSNRPDEATKKALYDELAAIKAWRAATAPTCYELQDELNRISAERVTLLSAHGIASWQEFEATYADIYPAWAAK